MNQNLFTSYGGLRLKEITRQTQILLDDFPRLFRPCESSFVDYGYKCGEGWFNLVYQLCANIENAATVANLDKHSDYWPLMKQIKVKFAVLRVYIDLPNSNEQDGELVKHIDALIKEAEDKTSAMCQDCGKKGSGLAIKQYMT